jgi:APA family basic amino acid/polyamine antiporter
LTTNVQAPSAAAVPENQELVKGIGLTTATTLVMGSMIGSGIFIVSADIARLVDSPALLIGAWLVTAFMTVTGALAYGELAAMMPRAGGQYVFLRESLGPLWGFLYGWTLFLVIQTGTIAAVGVAFGKFLGVFFPSISSSNWIWHIAHIGQWEIGPMVLGNMDIGLNTQNLIAILSIAVLTGINVLGLKEGAFVQNVFTVAKTAALVGLIIVGIFVGRNAEALAANFADFWRNASLSSLHPVQVGAGGPMALVGVFTILAVAQVGSLFSSDAWNNVTFTAAEVRNPRRNLPLALALGTGAVCLLYVLANFAYLSVLPLDGDPNGATALARGIKYAAEDRVATAAMLHMFGTLGAALMALAILISTFGCNNGLILAGARVYYAMAKDGLFFRSVGSVHPRFHTPVVSLVVQCLWTSVLCLSGTYGQLLDYIVFAVLVFYILTIAGLFVLRVKRPDAERPYRAFGYPVLPGLYILMALFIDVVLLRYKPQYTWPGLIIVLLGVPVYFLWSRSSARAAEVRT